MRPTRNEMWGRYRLRRRISVGGMAELYEADMRGPAGFIKPVCLKRIRPELSANPVFVQMFQSEARVAALLDHPNIVSVFSFDAQDGQLFLVMDYVDGLDLRQILTTAQRYGLRVPHELAVYVLDSLLAALTHAHGRVVEGVPRPVIHRDVSPQNVLVSTDGVVKLTDFGIAKAKGVSDETLGGPLKGKLGYLSPEQAKGNAVDHTTDLFSAGLVFYEVLTGNRFFKEKGEAFIQSVLTFEPQPIPWASPQLNDLIAHLVSPEPSDRFASAEAARAALGSIGIESLGERETAKLVQHLRTMAARSPDAEEWRPAYRKKELIPVGRGAMDFEQTRRSTATVRLADFMRKPSRAVTALTLLVAVIVGLVILGIGRWHTGEGDEEAAPPVASTPPHEATGQAAGATSSGPPNREQAVGGTSSRPLSGKPDALTDHAPRGEAAAVAPAGREIADNAAIPKSDTNPANSDRAREKRSSSEKSAPTPLTPSRNGTLSVNVRPWASVTVDGVDRGTTPLRALALSAGSHTVTLVNAELGYSETIPIRIEPGGVTAVNRVANE